MTRKGQAQGVQGQRMRNSRHPTRQYQAQGVQPKKLYNSNCLTEQRQAQGALPGEASDSHRPRKKQWAQRAPIEKSNKGKQIVLMSHNHARDRLPVPRKSEMRSKTISHTRSEEAQGRDRNRFASSRSRSKRAKKSLKVNSQRSIAQMLLSLIKNAKITMTTISKSVCKTSLHCKRVS